MLEIGLKYKGKKNGKGFPFILKNPRIGTPLEFTSKDTVVWVEKAIGDWLILNNPKMFDIEGTRGKEQLAVPIGKAVEVTDDAEDGPEVVIVGSKPPEKKPPKKRRGMPKGGWPKKGEPKKEKDNDYQKRNKILA